MARDHLPVKPDDQTHLRAVLRTAVEGIITIDERGMIESANPAAEALFGWKAEELLGKNVSVLMPQPYQSEHDRYLSDYISSGVPRIIGVGREVQGLRKDGSIFPMYLAVSEVRVAGRRIFNGFVHDLTVLKQTQNELAQRDAQLEFMVEHLPAAAAYVDLSKGIVRFNRMVREITGYEPAELTSLDRLFPLLFGESAAEARKRYEAARQIWNDRPLRLSIRRKSGDERTVELRGYAYDHHEVWLMHDVTERERHDTELRIRDRAIQAANEGVVIADAGKDGHPIVFVNEAYETLSGYSARESLGKGCEILCGSHPDQEVLKRLKHAIDGCHDFRTTIRCRRKNGEYFWNEISIAPVRATDGQVTHIVAVMEDVSERRSAHEQLLQSERLAAIGQMMTGLAHESRNALQRAQACLDMLSLDMEGNAEQLELTEKTRRALHDLHRHYEEVRNYAAPINLECRPTLLSRIWETTWKNLEAVRFGRDVRLIVRPDAEDLVWTVDEHRIEQVFRNVMENSLAACTDPGVLEITGSVTTHDQGKTLHIRISDNGPGFTPESAANVFQPFYTTKQKGTGLGMAISKRIVEAHGGGIHVEPSRQGAVVRIDLPQVPS
ncbi:MAG: PAS domain S-box protein [Planctomycetaceae bacterium]